MRKEMIVDWINNFVNYAIIVFLFERAIISGFLDSFDMFVAVSGLIFSITILTIRVITRLDK